MIRLLCPIKYLNIPKEIVASLKITCVIRALEDLRSVTALYIYDSKVVNHTDY